MDKNKIVMIAPVAVAAILMLGILAAAGNAQESSNTSSSQETSKTATGNAQESSNTSSSQESSQTNGATSPTSSQESSKTGNGATSPTSSQETSNGKKPTELTISASQKGPPYKSHGNTFVPLIISGRLTSEGSGVAGATIIINCDGEECETVKTDSGGHYSDPAANILETKTESHEIDAWTQHIPSDYNESSASTTIKTKTTTQTPTAVSNNVTRSPSGQPTGGNVAQGTQKSSITGNAAQGASNTGQGSPAKKPTELTLSVSPNGPAKTEENNETKETHTEVPVTISGRLTSEGSGVAGASIMIGMGEEEINTTDTDSGGNYSVATELPDHNSKHTIHAFTHTIPSDYNESSASTTIQLP